MAKFIAFFIIDRYFKYTVIFFSFFLRGAGAINKAPLWKKRPLYIKFKNDKLSRTYNDLRDISRNIS